MAHSVDSTQTNTASVFKSHVYTMAAAFVGVIFGVLGSMGFIGNYLQSQFAAQNASLSKQLVSAAPASNLTGTCYNPGGSGGSGSGNALTASAVGGKGAGSVGSGGVTSPNGGGKGGGSSNGGGKSTFVSQLINGSISNTGPNSSNKITASNSYSSTVTNTNNVSASNDNKQTANSGDATVTDNTTGGSATSGDATNHNSTNTMIKIEN